MTFSYSGDPAASDLDNVRFLIGDTAADGALYSNEEIAAVLARPLSSRRAAISLVDIAIARFARKIDRSIDGLTVKYSQVVANLKELREALVRDDAAGALGAAGGGFYAGGMDVAEGALDAANTTRTQPAFRRNQFPNRIIP